MVKVVRVKNGFMPAMCKGFSLIEIVVAIALIGLMAAIAIPRIRRHPLPESERIRQELSLLTKMAQLNAGITGKLHRIFFDFKQQAVCIEIAQEKRSAQGELVFEPVRIPYTKTSMPWDGQLVIEQFVVQGKERVSKSGDVDYTSLWFYVVPNGMTQEVRMVIRDTRTARLFSTHNNPFTARFMVA